MSWREGARKEEWMEEIGEKREGRRVREGRGTGGEKRGDRGVGITEGQREQEKKRNGAVMKGFHQLGCQLRYQNIWNSECHNQPSSLRGLISASALA